MTVQYSDFWLRYVSETQAEADARSAAYWSGRDDDPAAIRREWSDEEIVEAERERVADVWAAKAVRS